MVLTIGLSDGSGSIGTVRGTLLRVGGPAPGSPVPIPGQATLTDVASRTKFQATAGTDGHYSVALPPGTYRVSGKSPLVHLGNREMVGEATTTVRVQPNQASQADVYFSVP
ncbi:MAG: hypothetical protein ACRD6W_18205 [Nitrososphaerales archaeon]